MGYLAFIVLIPLFSILITVGAIIWLANKLIARDIFSWWLFCLIGASMGFLFQFVFETFLLSGYTSMINGTLTVVENNVITSEGYFMIAKHSLVYAVFGFVASYLTWFMLRKKNREFNN